MDILKQWNKFKLSCMMTAIWLAVTVILHYSMNLLPFGTEWSFSVYGCIAAVGIFFIAGFQR